MFHENILNSIRVMERIRKVNGRMDRQTDERTERHDIIRPVFDGRIIKVGQGPTVLVVGISPHFSVSGRWLEID